MRRQISNLREEADQYVITIKSVIDSFQVAKLGTHTVLIPASTHLLFGCQMKDEIKFSKLEMWIMLMSTVRYAMGRQSYMVDEANRLIRKCVSHLDKWQIEQLLREISVQLSHRETEAKMLGDQSSHNLWKFLVVFLKEKLNALPKQHY